MAEITLTIMLQLLQTAGILIGIVYYVTVIRNQQRSNNLYTFQQRMQTMGPSHYRAWANVLKMSYETNEDFNEKYHVDVNPEVYADYCYIGAYYNNVGYLLHEGTVDPETIFELYPPISIIRTWRRYELRVDEQNRATGINLWRYFRYLKDEAERRFPEIRLPDNA